MKKSIVLFLLMPLLAAAQGLVRLSTEDVSLRIRLQLESRGVNLEEVTRIARERRARRVQERRQTPSGTHRAQADASAYAPSQELVDKVSTTFDQLFAVYQDLQALDSAPDLYLNSQPVINAYASGGREIHIYVALTELVQDSPGELAFAMAHEMGHIVQQRAGALLFVPDNAEFDADVWGVLTSLVAGYDPYSGAGTLAKLSMVTGDVGLAHQFEDQTGSDAHKSFVTRIEVMYDALQSVCGINQDFRNLCRDYRQQVHPHFPSNAVL